MTAGLAAGALLGLLAAAFVTSPLLRRRGGRAGSATAADGRVRDLESEREMSVAALRDLEDDHETGKIGERDYRELRARLTARGVEVLRRLDETRGSAQAPRGAPRRARR